MTFKHKPNKRPTVLPPVISVWIRKRGGAIERGGGADEAPAAAVQGLPPERHLPLSQQRGLQGGGGWRAEEGPAPPGLQRTGSAG